MVFNDDTLIETRDRHPPRLLLMLLGDYWWHCAEQLPSAALVALLGEFGVSEMAARAALSRLVHSGLLITSKRGRQTFHGLSERAMHVLDNGAQHIFAFGQHTRPWDGVWSLVVFSIPEENRRLRHALRDRLRWLGFAPLYNGVWISPQDCLDEAGRLIAELAIESVTFFRAAIGPETPAAGLPQQAWDLDALRLQYQEFLAAVQQLKTRIENGQITPEEALPARTQLMNAWRGFLEIDPDLPDELLPASWPRQHVRRLFIETYDALGPLALQRMQNIVMRYSSDLASYATYHNFHKLSVIGQE